MNHRNADAVCSGHGVRETDDGGQKQPTLICPPERAVGLGAESGYDGGGVWRVRSPLILASGRGLRGLQHSHRILQHCPASGVPSLPHRLEAILAFTLS